MRAWENRPDCQVIDEPFYACYLSATGLKHPMWQEVLEDQSTDWDVVAEQLFTDYPDIPVYYQKQMTHHMLQGVDLSWAKNLKHCFLTRDPFEVVNSYREKMAKITVDDIGIVRQWELYQEISSISQQQIPVIDAAQVLQNPEDVLRTLCNHFEISFEPSMLQWPAGRRVSDGAWAPHWYQAVEQSTGFTPYLKREFELTEEQKAIAEASMEAYKKLLGQPIRFIQGDENSV